MSEVVCKQCGSIDDYTIQYRGNQRCAYCNGCGAYIKNIPYMPQKFYIGKYKDVLVSEVNDITYLEWYLANIQKISPSLLEAINEQLKKLKGGENGK